MKNPRLLIALGLLGAAMASAQIPSTLANFSSRGQIGQSSGSLIAGFVIEGSSAKSVLIRGVGPGLADFGVTNPAAAVSLRVYDASGNVVAASTGYPMDGSGAMIDATAAAVGAFPLTNSGDSATVASLPPGEYSIEVAPSAADAPDGAVLLELYDADQPGSDSRLVNMSTRGQVGATPGTMITGFVVDGDAPKTLFIRGVGQDLSQFGVTNAAGAVSFNIYDANGNLVTSGGNVTPDPTDVGAFPVNSSGDTSATVTLAPGAYTVEVIPTSADSSTGVGLVEVYDADSTTASQSR